MPLLPGARNSDAPRPAEPFLFISQPGLDPILAQTPSLRNQFGLRSSPYAGPVSRTIQRFNVSTFSVPLPFEDLLIRQQALAQLGITDRLQRRARIQRQRRRGRRRL